MQLSAHLRFITTPVDSSLLQESDRFRDPPYRQLE